ncbi:MAG: T9SS type A sorting domain-containing protein, partial [Bacteroidota bacterium]
RRVLSICNDLEYANGRVNAFAALQAAGGGTAPTCNDGIQNGQETGVDCGGPDCPACPSGCNGNEVTLTIVLDNYPEETSWTITNDAGQTVASGGTYGSRPDGSTVTEDLCLVDDCYTFTINDAYGDGICCAYGNGSYSLAQGSTVLASGGSFASSEATDFCLGGSGPDTTPPTTPTGLTASNQTDVTVGLSWNASSDNVGVTEYDVYNGSTLLGSVSGTAATVQGLTACTQYTFSVRAKDAAGNVSGAASVTTSTTGCGGGGNAGEISASFFETGWDDWNDGGSDCYRYSGSRSWEGSYSIRIRDNSGAASAMTSDPFNLSGLASVEISFYFYPNSMENGEDFWVRYNDGSGWQTVATYTRGTDFNNNTFYSATVTLPASQFNLSNNASFRIQCDASNNADRVYIDEVVITGFNTASAFTGEGAIATIEEIPTHRLFDAQDFGEADFLISPNPASDRVQITAQEAIQEVFVFSIDGRQLLNRRVDGVDRMDLDVSDLPTGVYVLSIRTEEEVSTERVVIRR